MDYVAADKSKILRKRVTFLEIGGGLLTLNPRQLKNDLTLITSYTTTRVTEMPGTPEKLSDPLPKFLYYTPYIDSHLFTHHRLSRLIA